MSALSPVLTAAVCGDQVSRDAPVVLLPLVPCGHEQGIRWRAAKAAINEPEERLEGAGA
jgi:hypothetical protein